MGGSSLAALTAVACAPSALGQGPGTATREGRPELLLQSCGAPGSCTDEPSSVTLDAQWRWLHDGGLRGCMEGQVWSEDVCGDPETCAAVCVLEGVTAEGYGSLYGVRPVERGLELGFVTVSGSGRTVGSRLYVMENDTAYKLVRLKNREIAFDVDVSALPCGLNAALYLVEMDARGGRSKAGAKFGTGYCDAQCPRGQKFVDGEANLKGWDPVSGGHWASCCPEMDIFEANSMSMAFTAHPCSTAGPRRVASAEARGACDEDGCDFNPYRLGKRNFFGPGASGVDSRAPFTVVTQFLTSDETDAGELVEIRQFYVQGGRAIESPQPEGVKGVHGNSLTPSFCDAAKKAFAAGRNEFREAGGLAAMGEALSRGMVLALSLWDDPATAMRWLDSATPKLPDDAPGVLRGPCSRSEGEAEAVEETNASASARFSNIRYGAIGATTPGLQRKPPSPPDEAEPFGGGRAQRKPPSPPQEATPQVVGAAAGAEAEGGHAALAPGQTAQAPAAGAAAWKCYHYAAGEDDDWCRGMEATSDSEFRHGDLGLCGGCLCCQSATDTPKDDALVMRFHPKQPEAGAGGPRPASPGTPPAHDCGTGDWLKWHREKQDWCCEHAQIACPEKLRPPHDCGIGERLKWHRAKQDWCCEHAQIACPEELQGSLVRLSASAVASPGGGAPELARVAGRGALSGGTASALAAALALAVAASAAVAAALRARSRRTLGAAAPHARGLLRAAGAGGRSPQDGEGEAAGGAASE